MKESPSAADKARAAELFKKSAEAYRLGDFQRAIELLDEAYARDPQPVLLYNRARAEEGLGNVDAAIAGYERFLTEEPNPLDRGAIEQRLVTLRRQRDERAALERERDAKRDEPRTPPPPTVMLVAPQSPEPREGAARRSVLPYVVAGAGAAVLAGGTVFGVLALSKNDDAAAEPVQSKAIDLKDGADGLATLSTISFVAGGVLIVGGAVWWLLDHGSGRAQQGSRPGVHLSMAGIGGTLP